MENNIIDISRIPRNSDVKYEFDKELKQMRCG